MFWRVFCNYITIPINCFFTSGFQDVDRDEVEELIPSSCLLDVLVQLQVPSNPRDYPKIAKIMMNLSKTDFKFDVTWLSSHFHDIDQIWLQQSQVINSFHESSKVTGTAAGNGNQCTNDTVSVSLLADI